MIGLVGNLKPRFAPRTLYARSLLIVILPLVVLLVVLAINFYERHWDNVTRWLAIGLAGEVGQIVERLERARTPEERREILNQARRFHRFAISLEPNGVLPRLDESDRFLSDQTLYQKLREQFEEVLSRPFVIDLRPDQPARVAFVVQLDDGVLRVLPPRKRVTSDTTTVFMAWMVGTCILLIAIAIYFLRRQVVPIRRLARVVDHFGKGRDVGSMLLEGPLEIRQATAAFNLMRQRILRYVSQRTEMLAAVSHDLRTPLTRMKLELEMLEAEGRDPETLADLKADVEDMQRIVEAYMDFARGEGGETVEPTDLRELLMEAGDRASRNGATVDLWLDQPLKVPLRPVAFRRCINNLLDNASRHAHWIGIRVEPQPDAVEITIDDDGPGIPEKYRDDVFRPFYRIDRSRGSGAGNVGLGLTIARDIVLAHGGDLTLGTAEAGGLRATLRLPC